MTNYGSGLLANWATGTPSVSTPATIAAAADGGVWEFGDSIASRTQYDLAVQLGPRGQTLAVNNWGGRPTLPTVDVLEDWLCTYGDPAPQIIMACGTNDIFDPPVMAAQIERTMALVGGRADVFWKDVQVCRTNGSLQVADQRNTGWVNQQIHAAVECHTNLHLIPWFNSLASVPSRLGKYLVDGVHPNPTTGQAFHNAIVLQNLPTLP